MIYHFNPSNSAYKIQSDNKKKQKTKKDCQEVAKKKVKINHEWNRSINK